MTHCRPWTPAGGLWSRPVDRGAGADPRSASPGSSTTTSACGPAPTTSTPRRSSPSTAASASWATWRSGTTSSASALILLGLVVAAHPSTPLGRGRGVVVGMLGCFLIGLLWICTYYVFSRRPRRAPGLQRPRPVQPAGRHRLHGGRLHLRHPLGVATALHERLHAGSSSRGRLRSFLVECGDYTRVVRTRIHDPCDVARRGSGASTVCRNLWRTATAVIGSVRARWCGPRSPRARRADRGHAGDLDRCAARAAGRRPGSRRRARRRGSRRGGPARRCCRDDEGEHEVDPDPGQDPAHVAADLERDDQRARPSGRRSHRRRRGCARRSPAQ